VSTWPHIAPPPLALCLSMAERVSLRQHNLSASPGSPAAAVFLTVPWVTCSCASPQGSLPHCMACCTAAPDSCTPQYNSSQVCDPTPSLHLASCHQPPGQPPPRGAQPCTAAMACCSPECIVSLSPAPTQKTPTHMRPAPQPHSGMDQGCKGPGPPALRCWPEAPINYTPTHPPWITPSNRVCAAQTWHMAPPARRQHNPTAEMLANPYPTIHPACHRPPCAVPAPPPTFLLKKSRTKLIDAGHPFARRRRVQPAQTPTSLCTVTSCQSNKAPNRGTGLLGSGRACLVAAPATSCNLPAGTTASQSAGCTTRPCCTHIVKLPHPLLPGSAAATMLPQKHSPSTPFSPSPPPTFCHLRGLSTCTQAQPIRSCTPGTTRHRPWPHNSSRPEHQVQLMQLVHAPPPFGGVPAPSSKAAQPSGVTACCVLPVSQPAKHHSGPPGRLCMANGPCSRLHHPHTLCPPKTKA
jgi:hypothetical protein